MSNVIFPDYHLHTYFSGDSEASIKDILKSAISLGIQEICITDHLDYHYPKTPDYFLFDIEAYFPTLLSIKEDYKDKITVKIGVEFGLQPDLGEKLEEIASYPFDFIIGSSHVIDHLDPYDFEYWEDKTSEEGIYRYFSSILENLEACKNFDIYAHLDYIIRYIPSDSKSYSYEMYKSLLENCLYSILEHGKGIELNTSGFKYGLNQPHPCIEILKQYRKLGGEIITVGSDAHKAEHVGYAFDKAYDILKACGYSYITTYENRKPQFIPISLLK